MTPFLKPLPLVGDFVLFEGRDWLVEATLVHGVVISDQDGAERYVPLSQIRSRREGGMMDDGREANVVSGVIDTKTGSVRIHSPAELTARDKVIKAAKALHAYCGKAKPLELMRKVDRVIVAVDALIAAEGED